MNKPKPGQIIRMTSKEAVCKYGSDVGFGVVECLDGSGDIWFEDNLPYCDKEGNNIQSRCLPGDCEWL